MNLLDAAAAFLEERQRLGRSKSYVAGQKKALVDLAGQLERRGRPLLVDAIVEEDLWSFLEAEGARGLAAGTLHVKAVALRLFFAGLCRRGAILRDPAAQIVLREPPKKIGFVPSPEQVKRLLEVCDVETYRGMRDRAILELLYGSGLRLGEVRSLDVGDVDLAGRTALIKNAKGKKDRMVALTEACAEALRRYLQHARPSSQHAAFFARQRRPRGADGAGGTRRGGDRPRPLLPGDVRAGRTRGGRGVAAPTPPRRRGRRRRRRRGRGGLGAPAWAGPPSSVAPRCNHRPVPVPRYAPRLDDPLRAVPALDLDPDGEIVDAVLDGANCAGAPLDGMAAVRCRFIGVRFTGASLTRLRALDVEFVRCDFAAADLSEANLQRVRFTDCRATGADLSRRRP